MTGTIDLEAVVAGSPDGIVCADEAGRVVYANRAAQRMLGRAWEGLAGLPFASVVELGEETRGSSASRRATGVRPDGTEVPLEVSLSTYGTRGEQFMAAILRDASCSMLSAERDAFLSAAAHQLRAPIQPIVNSLRTLERALQTGRAPPPDTLPRALRQALRLGRLVDAILQDAAPRGEAEVHVSPFDLAAFTRDVVADFQQASPEHRIVYAGPSEGVVVTSDPGRVHQILVGLIDNALKYSERKRAVVVELCATDTRVALRVIDEGIGIPAAEQDRVFGKYYRATNVPRYAGGLGVGLYLAQRLSLRLHGGLSVSSEEGRGSKFSLWLPRSWPDEDSEATPARRGSGGESDVRTST